MKKSNINPKLLKKLMDKGIASKKAKAVSVKKKERIIDNVLDSVEVTKNYTSKTKSNVNKKK